MAHIEGFVPEDRDVNLRRNLDAKVKEAGMLRDEAVSLLNRLKELDMIERVRTYAEAIEAFEGKINTAAATVSRSLQAKNTEEQTVANEKMAARLPLLEKAIEDIRSLMAIREKLTAGTHTNNVVSLDARRGGERKGGDS